MGAVVSRSVPRDHRETDVRFRQRRIISALVLLAGTLALAASLRMEQNSPWFPLAALGVAAVWAIGSFASGTLHLGWVHSGELLRRPIWQPIAVGALLAAVFIVGAFVTVRIPPLAAQAREVLGFATSGSIWLLTVTTLLSGIAEELFFRGGLYAAVREPHQVLVTTVAYIAATLATGNPLLAFAAGALGWVTALERRATGGVLAPALTHVTWSLTMLHVLPFVF
ncbi:MAG: CPBP family intramembrane metalloprotease [Actinomycetales bacterium]|nr:CPBP family intramembrane metalloprotease [Actinomycetales bacterium]